VIDGGHSQSAGGVQQLVQQGSLMLVKHKLQVYLEWPSAHLVNKWHPWGPLRVVLWAT